MGESAAAQAQILTDHVLKIASILDRVEVSKYLAKAATELTGAQFAAVSVLDSHGDTLQFISYGLPETMTEHPPITHPIFNDVPLGRWLIINDITKYTGGNGLPEGHPHLNNFLGVPITVNEQVWGRLYLAEKAGGFTDDDGELISLLASAAAITVVNSQLYDESVNRNRWLAASQKIVSSLLEGSEEEEALEVIAHEMRIAAQAAAAILVLPSIQDRWISEIVDTDGSVPVQELLGIDFPPDGRARTVIREQSGLVVDSMQRLRTVRVPKLRAFGPALYAPLISHGTGRGVMILLRPVGSLEFNLHDLALAESVAKQATIAIQLAEARQAQALANELDERARISRDLHDLAIQQLFASGMHITAIREELESQGIDPSVSSALDNAISAIDDSVKQIRQIVHLLRDDGSSAALVPRLQHEASVARQALGYAPSLLLTWNGKDLGKDDDQLIDDAVGSDIADDVVAVVREGLSNAARHAKAASASVEVDACPKKILVRVIDDGQGMATSLMRRSGLSNLAARARRHHGTFEIGQRADGHHGTVLQWQVPLS